MRHTQRWTDGVQGGIRDVVSESEKELLSMWSFITCIAVLGIAYGIYRLVDQLPDVLFRVSEIQRDIADIRRKLVEDERESDEA
ncbi:MAG: hypothetical protein VYC36_03660 [Pseudomonadota bacterium]|uniref:Uncharacterized protein n=1 Tax=marine metagenome TaxID=408172 RepID=A0A381NRZ6_9ZZZZ|nr:hypothetical protein [Gammaproteobacteria bacterium]MEC9285050.1 hypothetical protein [Pseudomonadota bacterium]HBP14135.1 hypothetical protein [Gammaproteobacteria bacterium]HCP49345.1 hypothetical protein [Gammaproteobacteria bacterium]